MTEPLAAVGMSRRRRPDPGSARPAIGWDRLVRRMAQRPAGVGALGQLVRDGPGGHQGFWLAVGLWSFTYLAFLVPGLAEHGHVRAAAYPITAAAVSVGLVLSLPLSLLMRAMRRWFLPLRMVVAALVAAAAAWTHAVLDLSITDVLARAVDPVLVPDVTLATLVGRFLGYLWIHELFVTATGLLISSDLAHERHRQLLALRATADRAQLSALRCQLNPHFLFNTLNAISGLVVTRRAEQAEEMLSRLSGFLRASLAADPQATVALEDELQTLEAYLKIETVRFGTRLAYELVCEPGIERAPVPSLILQPLVEDAIEYAVSPSRTGARIRVEASAHAGQLRIAVTDDGTAAPEELAGATGVGFENVRQRLAMIYGRGAGLETGRTSRGFSAVISLPFTPAKD